jgi:hypothetical protein
MKKEKQARADSGGASVKKQPQTKAARQVQMGTTVPKNPAGATSSPASIAAAKPVYAPKRDEQEEARAAHNLHSEIEPGLYLWAQYPILRGDCLHYICQAVSNNAAALAEHAVYYWRGCNGQMVLAGENFALLEIAKGIAADGVIGRGLGCEKLRETKVSFHSLPGLAGLLPTDALDVLYHVAEFLYAAKDVIEEKIIGPMADRRKALELVEAMVLVENVLSHGGSHSDLDRPEGGHYSETRMIRLARQVLLEAMLQGGRVEGGAR